MRPKHIALVALFASVLGLVFASYSTFDYAQHLDRQIHAIHCSFIPGASASSDADNPCKTALFSPYSAIFRESYWGGVPISLFAVGAFSFFVGFGLYLTVAGERAKPRAWLFLSTIGVTPFLASLVMFFISATRLHTFCKVCVGIYFSSTVLAVAGVLAFLHQRKAASAPADPNAKTVPETSPGSPMLVLALAAALGASALLPPLVYTASLPDYRPFLTSCGKLAVKTESHKALLKIPTTRPVQPVTLFEDPLCPTCKAFHERLVDEGIFERLDVTMAMFPLDSECNWMLDRALHPGACELARAVLCDDKQSRAVLEWAYDNQDDLRELGKNPDALKAKIQSKWGPEIGACAGEKNPTAPVVIRLNRHLHYASDNHIPVSTPQMFLGERRICDEDTDLGLKYTLAQLAPEVLK